MVDPDSMRWERTQTIFHQVVALPAGAREVELRALCEDDPELIADVRELLDEDARGDFLLDGGIAPLASGLLDVRGAACSDFIVGKQLGPYRIERMLGGGGHGCGVTWLHVPMWAVMSL